MKTCIDAFFEKFAGQIPAESLRRERLLTEAEIEELLCDIPGATVGSYPEIRRPYRVTA